MFALGGAVLWGLFQAPRSRSPASPAVPWAAPSRVQRFVSLDLTGASAGGAVVQQVRSLDPDYVLVQNVRFDDVLPLAEALDMARSYHPQLFQRPDARAKAAPGDLILSRHPLYDAGPITLHPDATRTDMRGVRAVSVVDGVRFTVASGVGGTDESRRALDASRVQLGSPPIVLATGQSIDADPSWVTVSRQTLPLSDGNPPVLAVELKARPASASASTRPSR
jgi:hypothetical protein